MRSFAIVAVVVSWATVAVAQAPSGQLHGVVEDEDGAPIAGAVVTVEGTDVLVSTGDDGKFAVTVPAGSHQVSVFADGYEALQSPAVVTAAAATPVRYSLGLSTVG